MGVCMGVAKHLLVYSILYKSSPGVGSAGALDSLQLSLVRELVPPAALDYEGSLLQEQEGPLACG